VKPLKILYIAGCSRTGSTIVGRILGQAPGFSHVGELRELWDLIREEGQLCGCSTPLRQCTFWTRVFEQAFGGFSDALTQRYSHLIRVQRPVRTRNLLLQRPERVRQQIQEVHGGILSELRALYGAIASTDDAEVVVDGSKFPGYAFLLGAMPDVELHVLHLVRDPRAVAYSWAKRTKRDPRASGFERMEAKGILHTCRAWNERNLLARRLWGRDPAHYALLRYEDFLSDPRGSLQPVLRMVGHPDAALPLAGRAMADLVPCHTVGGNPSRFTTGRVSLHSDGEWRTGLHPVMKHAVSVLSYPWLRTYGYSAFANTRLAAMDHPQSVAEL
jgi:hypothetical protein